ncbi:MAG TPA: ferritin-like domain-containing protein [Cytophagales bacterium]|nr:ferritin-like domain-containing protein [Cytophagales bacterium]
MELKSLKDLLIHTLQDVYSAEKQIIKALPKMIKATSNEELKKAFETHLKETEKQKERLEQVFDQIGARPGRMKCKAMEGLVEEGKELMEEDIDADVLDAGLIAAAQKIEHYEIATYGTARVYAEQLGEEAVTDLLSQTLEEERKTDELLTDLAMSSVNLEAEHAGKK